MSNNESHNICSKLRILSPACTKCNAEDKAQLRERLNGIQAANGSISLINLSKIDAFVHNILPLLNFRILLEHRNIADQALLDCSSSYRFNVYTIVRHLGGRLSILYPVKQRLICYPVLEICIIFLEPSCNSISVLPWLQILKYSFKR